MNDFDHEYKRLLKLVMEKGVDKSDRTGTGTKSVFGAQAKFDLRQGFPLLTTKKVFTRGIVHELLWFISGQTNIGYLLENKVNIWNEWTPAFKRGGKEEVLKCFKEDNQHPDLELGPVYGFNWRKYGSKPDRVSQPKPICPVQPTYLGVACGKGSSGHPLKKTWEGMIARCYDVKSASYSLYGAKGVYVCNDWLNFENFARDAVELPNYDLKRDSQSVRYVLDKDLKGSGFCYSKDHCVWVTDKDNNPVNSNHRYYTVEKDSQEYKFSNISEFCRQHNLEAKNFSDLWTKSDTCKTRQGFSLVKTEHLQYNGFDQLGWVIERIKTTPDCRRLIVSAWNPMLTELMALPPCHTMFQFNVEDGYLNLQLYQRSADLFLGVPFNIASYALLLELVAQVTGLKAGVFTHTFGDLHIYNNHVDQVKTQMKRKGWKAPVLELNKSITDIDGFKYDDINVVNYFPEDAIKAEISI